MDWATLAAAGVLTIVPGAIVIWFVRHYIAKGFAMGRFEGASKQFACLSGMDGLDHCRWRCCFMACIVLHARAHGMTVWEIKSPTTLRKGFLPIATTRGDRLFIGLLRRLREPGLCRHQRALASGSAWRTSPRSGSASWLVDGVAG
jgi:hypothetical protein